MDFGRAKGRVVQAGYAQFKAAGSNHVPLIIRVPSWGGIRGSG